MARTGRDYEDGHGQIRLFDADEIVYDQVDAPGGQLAVEWRGHRVGHPSTYGLLGGRRLSEGEPTRFSLPPDGGIRVTRSLYPATYDTARLQLPHEYRHGILTVVEASAVSVEISVAIESAGSSENVFRWLTSMLVQGITLGAWPRTDKAIWDMWAIARPERATS